MKSSTRRKILASLPGTMAEITVVAGVSYGTLRNYMPTLCKDGDAHISSWVRTFSKGANSAVFAAGPGEDAPRCQAPAVTQAVTQDSYQAHEANEPTVSYAMRTQPSSVFAMGARA